MSADKKESSEESKNGWVTPTVIVAVIGLIGTLATLYFGYLQNTRPLELAATQTAEARAFDLTLAALTPSPARPTTVVPSPTPSPVAPTETPLAPTFTATREPTLASGTFTPGPTRTARADELQFCINSRNINVRSGPGTDYGPIGILTFLDCPYFDGQNPDASWIRISGDQENYLSMSGGWVRTNLVRPQDFNELPIIYPPTATPTLSPTPTPEG